METFQLQPVTDLFSTHD
ncbi:hypothetical protein F383_39317 [Gossypium arboreum]|uniref:Uncharacterized protein n=1 Tax=Gossypium arboreum TaxID=29729 RepID=A0A0B0MIP1_GOSAR|nr:hypothetical protein F383_39317 [Gossypium arboreum]